MDDFNDAFKRFKQFYNVEPGFEDGGSVTTSKRGLVDEPGSYAGSLSKNQIKLLKDNLSKEEFSRLDFKSEIKGDTVNYGIRQRDDRDLFNRVRRIVNPYQDRRSTTSQIFDNKVLVKRITKLAKEGKTSNEIFDQLKKLKYFPKTYKANNIASAINELVRQKKIPEEFKKAQSSGRTAGENLTRKQNVLDIVDNAIKEKRPIPSLKKIATELGFKTSKEVGLIIEKEKGKGFYEKNFKNMQTLQKGRIIKLANNGKIKQALTNGTILDGSNPRYVAKLLGVNQKIAGSVLYDLQKAYAGEKNYITKNELPKINATKSFNKIKAAAKANPFNNPLYAKTRQADEGQLSKTLGEKTNIFNKARRSVTNTLKPLFKKFGLEGVSTATDELATIGVPTKHGGEGYSLFQQVLTKTGNKTIDDVNLEKAKKLDRKLLTIRQKIVNGTVKPGEIELYNRAVNKITADINKNIPKGSKKVQAITITPKGDPNITVKNLNQIKKLNPTAYNNIIADAKKYGVSYNIPKDVENVYSLQNKKKVETGVINELKKGFKVETEEQLKNVIKKTNPKNIKNIFNKSIRRVLSIPVVGPIAAGIIGAKALTIGGEAEAADGTQTTDSFPTKTTAGAALAAGAIGTKTGRNILGKVFKAVSAIDAPLLAGAYGGYYGKKLFDDIRSNKKTNVSATDITLAPAFTNLAAKDLGLYAKRKGLRKGIDTLLRGGMSRVLAKRLLPMLSAASVYATPVIEGSIAGYNAKKNLEAAREKYGMEGENVDTFMGQAPKEYYNEMMSNIPAEGKSNTFNNIFTGNEFTVPETGVGEFSAAGGGIAKLAGKRSGPAPQSGPTPQGLDYLLKRGRQY